MSDITQLTTVTADLAGAQAQPAALPAANPTPPKPPSTNEVAAASSKPPAEPQQSLVISQGAQTGIYVYTILDRVTGQVLVQIPRSEVVKLANRPDYSAGQVFNTKV